MSLRAESLSCGYAGHALLRNLSVELRAGDLLLLLGPNGVGKTTLFRTLLGLLAPIGGVVNVDGRDIHQLSAPERARRIAFVPQAGGLTFPFSALDVALMGRAPWLRLHRSPSGHDRRIVEEVFETLQLTPLASKPFPHLSSGERQLVMIARALVQTPRYLVLDEPTSNLDFGNQSRILREVCRLCRSGLGVMMTTHQPNHVFETGGKVLLLDRAGRVHSGHPERVMTEDLLAAAFDLPVELGTHTSPSGRSTAYCLPASPIEEP